MARRDQKPRTSQVRPTGRFDPCADAVTPEGYGCYCADQNAVAVPGGPTPPKGPAHRMGRARKGITTAGSERTWQSPSNLLNGAVTQIVVTPLQKRTQPES